MTSEIDSVINAPAGLKDTMGAKVDEVFTALEEGMSAMQFFCLANNIQ